MPPGWWAFTTTWQAVWKSGTLQKDGAKPEYPNLFKGRQPYRLKIHSKTLRRSFSKSDLAVPSSKIVSRLPVSVYFYKMLLSCWHLRLAFEVYIPLWLNKIHEWRIKKRAPVTRLAKCNYLEERWFVKIANFKSCEIFSFQIREIKVARK